MDENDVEKIEPTDSLYNKRQQILNGAWMMWQNAEIPIAQNAANAIAYFEKKYNLRAREIAIVKKVDIGIPVSSIVVPDGQTWVR